jgi:hypothetical protein
LPNQELWAGALSRSLNNISDFFKAFLSRCSISNQAQVVDKRIVDHISSLWASQSSFSFQQHPKWVKSYTFSYQSCFHFLKNFISRCCPYSGFEVL